MRCPTCNHTNRAGVKFCENCDAVLSAAPPQQVTPIIIQTTTRRSVGYIFSWILSLAILAAISLAGLMLFEVIATPAFAAPLVDPLFDRLRTNIASIYDAQPAPGSGSQSSSAAPAAQSSSSSSQDQAAGSGQDLSDTCHRSKFVSETVPDNTVFNPGENFSKSWTLRNGGDCTWSMDYELRFIEGDRLGGSRTLPVEKTVKPDETVTFTLNLTAPNTPGTYTGVWQLFAVDGTPMGRYWVIITVADPAQQPADPPPVPPTPPFAVTNLTHNLVDVSVSECPYPKDLSLTFTASGSGTATYEIVTSDLGNQGQDTITFIEAGSKSTSYTWTFTYSADYWLKVNILEPNKKTFGPYYFSVSCP